MLQSHTTNTGGIELTEKIIAGRIEKGGNIRINHYMRPETRKKLKRLAFLDGRSASNFMTVLVNREFERMEESES